MIWGYIAGGVGKRNSVIAIICSLGERVGSFLPFPPISLVVDYLELLPGGSIIRSFKYP